MIPPYRDLGLLRLVLNGVKDVLTPQAKLWIYRLKQIFQDTHWKPQVMAQNLDQAISKPSINV
jgi:hypothetical protein